MKTLVTITNRRFGRDLTPLTANAVVSETTAKAVVIPTVFHLRGWRRAARQSIGHDGARQSAGVYAWWFCNIPPGTPSEGCWAVAEKPWEVEAAAIRSVCLPLNLAQNSSHFTRSCQHVACQLGRGPASFQFMAEAEMNLKRSLTHAQIKSAAHNVLEAAV